MNKSIQILAYAAVLFLAIAGIYKLLLPGTKNDFDKKELLDRNAVLKKQYDSIVSSRNVYYDSLSLNKKQIEQLQSSIDEQHNSLKRYRQEYDKLKKEYEKVNRVDSFKSNDIVLFFSERYKN